MQRARDLRITTTTTTTTVVLLTLLLSLAVHFHWKFSTSFKRTHKRARPTKHDRVSLLSECGGINVYALLSRIVKRPDYLGKTVDVVRNNDNGRIEQNPNSPKRNISHCQH